MATQTFVWTTSCRLTCDQNLPASVFLCLDPTVTDPGQPTDSGFIEASISRMWTSCGQLGQLYNYEINYDSTLLQSGFVLNAYSVKGVICKDCLTDFIENRIALATEVP